MTGMTQWKRQGIRAAVLVGLAAALFAAWRAFQLARPREVPILMYHGIGEGRESVWIVRTSDFEKHLQHLRREGYESILPSDLVAHRRWGKPLPRKPVILTFDDGYLNNLENAEPLLRKYGFRGIVYLITGLVADSPGERKTYEGSPCLTWDEVRAMRRRGVLTFGGHTRNHVNLAAAGNPVDEIGACYRDIRDKAGFRPDSFCYPFGQYRDSTPERVRKAGFTTAVTCHGDVFRTGRSNRDSFFVLPRASVYGGTQVYHVERLPAEPGSDRVSVKVWKEGVRVTSIPRLVRAGAGPDEGWAEPVRISQEPVLLSWRVPAGARQEPLVLSLWGDLRVLPHWQEELRP